MQWPGRRGRGEHRPRGGRSGRSGDAPGPRCGRGERRTPEGPRAAGPGNGPGDGRPRPAARFIVKGAVSRYEPSLARLIGELVRLPGIGPKRAQRLTFHLLKASKEEVFALAQAIIELKERARG